MKHRPKRSPDGEELRALPEKYDMFRNAYMVTASGNVTRIRAASGTQQFRVLKPSNGPHGYLTVSLKVAPTEHERLQAWGRIYGNTQIHGFGTDHRCSPSFVEEISGCATASVSLSW